MKLYCNVRGKYTLNIVELRTKIEEALKLGKMESFQSVIGKEHKVDEICMLGNPISIRIVGLLEGIKPILYVYKGRSLKLKEFHTSRKITFGIENYFIYFDYENREFYAEDESYFDLLINHIKKAAFHLCLTNVQEEE